MNRHILTLTTIVLATLAVFYVLVRIAGHSKSESISSMKNNQPLTRQNNESPVHTQTPGNGFSEEDSSSTPPAYAPNDSFVENTAFMPETPANIADEDIASLVSLIQDPETSQSVRKKALDALLKWVSQEEDREAAFESLREVTWALKQEDLQFALKAMRPFSDLGANEAIVDTFIESASEATPIDRMRMLSYLDPQYPLNPTSVVQLEKAYLESHGSDLAMPLLQAIATAGGETGLYWIVDRMVQTNKQKEWNLLIDVLGNSGSQPALSFLHRLLNTVTDQGLSNEESKARIREAILGAKKPSS